MIDIGYRLAQNWITDGRRLAEWYINRTSAGGWSMES